MSKELCERILERNLKEIRNLLIKQPTIINELDPESELSPLAITVKEGLFAICRYLIIKGADVNNEENPPINYIHEISFPKIKKRFIAEFLNSPNLAIGPIKRQSLECIINKISIKKISGDRKTLSQFASYLAFFGAKEKLSRFLEMHKDTLDPDTLNEDGLSLLYCLICRRNLWDILSKFPKLIENGNFDVAPIKGNDAGKTALWWLVYGTQRFNYPELLKGSNLNARPTAEKDYNKGTTILWLLAKFTHERQLLKSHPELLEEGDLDATPSYGEYAGKKILDYFAHNSEWPDRKTLQTTLSKLDPTFLKKLFAKCPQDENHSCFKNEIALIILRYGLSKITPKFLSRWEIVKDKNDSTKNICDLLTLFRVFTVYKKETRKMLGDFLLTTVAVETTPKSFQDFLLAQLQKNFGKPTNSNSTDSQAQIKQYGEQFLIAAGKSPDPEQEFNAARLSTTLATNNAVLHTPFWSSPETTPQTTGNSQSVTPTLQ